MAYNPATGNTIDQYGGYWKQIQTSDGRSNSNWAVDQAPSYKNVYIGPGGTQWASQSAFLGSGGGAGASPVSSGGTMASFSSTPTGTSAYTPPKAVDQTNVYEKKLLSLLDNPDSIANTGAYKFRFNQGQQALERSAAAKGMTGSGNTLAALADYGQGQASQAYNTEADRLGGLTGMQKNYIRDLLNVANQESATANQFNLGSQKNAIDWNLGTERNSISRLAAENQGLATANQIHSGKGAYDYNMGGRVMSPIGGSTPSWHNDASRNFFNRDDRAIAYAY